ncbi:protein kinase, ATP binding site-containing protein [Tanacetum coccineum]
MSDMTACLNDLSYIPLNNEQNEPTQGDIGETSNEPTQAKRNEFEELYASANEELYPGCDYVTRLDFMAKFTYFKVKGKLTDSIFNEMLEFFQNVFPTSKGYKLPPSYYAIKKTFKTIGLGYESIHACVNDCFLFWGDDNKDVHFCPVCNTSRWKDSNTPGKKVPKKVLRYFPIIPRLQRLYKSSHTAKEMTWHATGKCTEPGVETINVATGHKFNMRAMVLWTINDFSARSSLSGWSRQGYKACPTCNEDTPSTHGDPPRKFDRDGIMAQLTRLPMRVKGKHPMYGGVKIKCNQYLPADVAKPIIELCLFFKQICSQTLMEDDMLKAQSKVVDIMCNLELIYPPGFFNIMIHLVIYLPLEALKGGPIRP